MMPAQVRADAAVLFARLLHRPAVSARIGQKMPLQEQLVADRNKLNGRTAKRPVLLVLHQEHSTPGRVGHALTRLGVPLDIRRPRFGDPLPKTMDAHAGAIVFGGPMSANDEDDYIRREIGWMSVPLSEQRPLIGICLGAQMLARQLGGRVYCHVDGRAEVGYYPIHPTREGLAIADKWPSHVYEWHREGFDLPPGAVLLATGDTYFPVQAFRYGPAAFAIQFHPEVTYAMACRWTVRGHERLDLPGAKPRSQHFADRAAYDFAVRAWLTGFLDHWLHSGPPVERTDAAKRALRRVSAGMSSAETLVPAL
jgi:GMP synthase (glutamine-hydrolysing)